MIEINLIDRGEEGLKVPVLLGVDLKKIPWFSLALSLAVLWSVSHGVDYYFDQKVKEVEATIAEMEKQFKRIDKKVRDNEKVRDMLVEFEKVNADLKVRTVHIREILSQKANPRRIFERVSADIPNNLWLGSLKIENRKIEIDGWASSYEDIGKFISQANQSKFFGKTLKLSNEQVRTTELDIAGKKRNVEVFKILGDIVAFD